MKLNLLDQPVQTQRCWEVTEHAPTGDEEVEAKCGEKESFCKLIQTQHLDAKWEAKAKRKEKKFLAACPALLYIGLLGESVDTRIT